MKIADLATQAALAAAPDAGIRVRDLVWIRARTLAGTGTAEFGFWNDIGTVPIDVRRGDSGNVEARPFVGDGSLISVGPISYSSELTVQSVSVGLSQLHPDVQDMARGHDLRQAEIEIFRVFFDPRTNAVIGPASSRLIGKVNKAQISTPKTGDEGGIDLTCVSHIREMTRTNPAKKSDETQKRRSGDRFRRYIGTVNVDLFWGQKSGKPGGNSGSGSGMFGAGRNK